MGIEIIPHSAVLGAEIRGVDLARVDDALFAAIHQALLDYLRTHSIRPEFTTALHWEVGTLGFWDNRCVQHMAVNDYHGHRRVMHRITVCGERTEDQGLAA